MTLPASPPISLQNIQDEFGAPRSTGQTAFYRGGAWVPNIAQNSGVPTSGSIGLLSLLGATKYVPMSGGASNVVGATSSGNVNQFVGAGSISVSNGIPPYTYLTSFVSGSTFGLSAQTTNAPSFLRSGNPGPGTVVGNYQCVVTDATLATITLPFTVTDNRT